MVCSADPMLDKAAAVAETVKGLLDGTVDPKQADALLEEIESAKRSKEYAVAAAEQREAARKQQIITERTRGRSGKGGDVTGETYEWFCLSCSLEFIEPDITKLERGTHGVGQCWKCGQKLISRTARQTQLKAKVAEMAAARENRAQRREQFAKYQKLKATKKAAAAEASAAAGSVQVAGSAAAAGSDSGDSKLSVVTPGAAKATPKPGGSGRVTDYDAWEFWEADSDDEGREPILPKNDPTFKMMEYDMEQKWAKRKQAAKDALDHKKTANDHYAKKDYARAIDFYGKVSAFARAICIQRSNPFRLTTGLCVDSVHRVWSVVRTIEPYTVIERRRISNSKNTSE